MKLLFQYNVKKRQEKDSMVNQNLFQPRIKTVRTPANIQAMQHAIEQQNLNADPLDKQVSSRWNPVLAANQQKSARLILKEDLGGAAYTIRKVRPFFYSQIVPKKNLSNPISFLDPLTQRGKLPYSKVVCSRFHGTTG